MTEMLEYVLPIYGVSNLWFFIIITEEATPPIAMVVIIISILHALLPMQTLNEKIFKIKESDPNKLLYDEALV